MGRIRQKRDLLNGICKEASEILEDRRVSLGVFALLRKAKPICQIEIAELLQTTANYSVPYAKALFAATRVGMLVDQAAHKWVGCFVSLVQPASYIFFSLMVGFSKW